MNDIAKAINEHVERIWPADKMGRRGRLYYIGEVPYPDGSWMLDGMTPVDDCAALHVLERAGVNVDPIMAMMERRTGERRNKAMAQQALRASAAAKLTAEEREACGL